MINKKLINRFLGEERIVELFLLNLNKKDIFYLLGNGERIISAFILSKLKQYSVRKLC
jgi:hypothetical protein